MTTVMNIPLDLIDTAPLSHVKTSEKWLERLMALADEYAHLSACEVEGCDAIKDHDDTQKARAALMAHAKGA